MLNYNNIYNGKEDTVVFIHAFGGNHSIFKKQIDDFSKFYNLILIDLNGHGQSKDMPLYKEEQQNFEFLVNEIIEVLNHNNIEEAHFVSLSFGSMITAMLCKIHPERVLSVISMGDITKETFNLKVLIPFGWYGRYIMSFKLIYLFFVKLMIPGNNHKKSRNILIKESLKLGKKEFFAWYKMIKKFYDKCNINDFINKVPTLYIMGSDDHMFKKSAEKLKDLNKKGEISIIEDAGHLVNIDSYKEVNNIAVSFIKRCESINNQGKKSLDIVL